MPVARLWYEGQMFLPPTSKRHQEWGGTLLLLFLGGKRVYFGSRGAVYDYGDEFCHEPARKVKAVDSTAAGDTFTAGIVVSLLEGNTMKNAVRFATKASSVVVTRMGTLSSIPDRAEVESL